MRLLQRILLPALVATVVLSLSAPAAMAKGHDGPKAHAAKKEKPPKKPPKDGGGGTTGPVADTGTRDFSYSGASAPTGQKPQSKLWFNDGSWWGVLYNSAGTIASGKGWHIYRFDWD